MSGYITGWVLTRSPVRDPHELLVLVVLSDCAHDDGGGAFPAVATIADRARISRRKVQYVLRDLEAAGHIQRQGVTKKGTAIWQVVTDVATANGGVHGPLAGDAQRAPVHAGAPKPSVEPSCREERLSSDGSKDGSGAQDAQAAWARVVDAIKERVSPIAFAYYIEPLELEGRSGDTLILAAPPHAVTERHVAALETAARAEFGAGATVELRLSTPMREVS